MAGNSQEEELAALYHRALLEARRGRACVLFGDSSHRYASRQAAATARSWGWDRARLERWAMEYLTN